MQGRKGCLSFNKRQSEQNGNCAEKISKNDINSRHKRNRVLKLFPIGEEYQSSTTGNRYNFNPFDLATRELYSVPSPNASLKSSQCVQSRPMSQCSMDSGCDTDSVTESILSFASRSSDDECSTDSDIYDNSCTTELENLSKKLKETSSQVQSCLNTGFLLPILSDSSGNNVLIPQISALTLANLLSDNHTLSNRIKMFDCRYPYEYAGGHVTNSVNVYTCKKLLQTLFPGKKEEVSRDWEEDINQITARQRRKLKRDETIYIFYCEFSSYRGPKLAQCLRGLDRLANSGSRDLYFPHIYVVNNGYSGFYNDYPQLCSPNGYVSMRKNHYSLGNTNPKTSNQKRLHNEHTQYDFEMRDSLESLQDIITKRTTDIDILHLFSSHSTVGAS